GVISPSSCRTVKYVHVRSLLTDLAWRHRANLLSAFALPVADIRSGRNTDVWNAEPERGARGIDRRWLEIVEARASRHAPRSRLFDYRPARLNRRWSGRSST